MHPTSILTEGAVTAGGFFDMPRGKRRRRIVNYAPPQSIDRELVQIDPEFARKDAVPLNFWQASWGLPDDPMHIPLPPNARLSTKGCPGHQQHHGESLFEMKLRWQLRTWARLNCFRPWESPGSAARRHPAYSGLLLYRRVVTKNPTLAVMGGCPCHQCRY